MTPIEAVARALDSEAWAYPEDGPDIRLARENRQDSLEKARAALAALREPTPGMIDAMDKAYIRLEVTLQDIWQAGIDAAMEE